MLITCSKCGSNDWDYANVGLSTALVCFDCGSLSTGRLCLNDKGKTPMKTPNTDRYDTNESPFEADLRCPNCGAFDPDPIVIDCYGIETNCYQCLECGQTFGGGL